MPDPACISCRHYEPGFRNSTGNCNDPSKRIYPRRGDIYTHTRPPEILDPEIYTCRNHHGVNLTPVFDPPPPEKLKLSVERVVSTYSGQPERIGFQSSISSVIGECLRHANAKEKAGDTIDSGLLFLNLLNECGLTIIAALNQES